MAAAAEAEDPNLVAVQITYLDPESSHVCRRDVFCDPEEWSEKRRKEPRFLISSDLVNILQEAIQLRHERFEKRHLQLAKARFGYECVLQKLRGSAERIALQIRNYAEAEGDDSDSGDNKRTPIDISEVGAIRYYLPEQYLDSYTCEKFSRGLQRYLKMIEAEIKEVNGQIAEQGFKGWYDIMGQMIDEGGKPVEVGDKLLEMVKDESERWEIEEKMSGGFRSKYDALLPKVNALEEEVGKFKDQEEICKEEVRTMTTRILVGEQRTVEVKRELERPPPYLRPDSESEESEEEPIDDSVFRARLAEAKRKLFADWEEFLRLAKEEAEKAHEYMLEWEAKFSAFDRSELSRLEEEIKAAEAVATSLRKKKDKVAGKLRELQAKLADARALITAEESVMGDLKSKLSELPPPPDRSLWFVRLQKQYKKLLREQAEIQKAMLIPINKVKVIRMELRRLYKKLGWEWDFSDSEDEAEKPYWQRRKLAVDGLTPFDPNVFVYEERGYHARRIKNLTRKEQSKRAAHLLSQMVANRHLHSQTVQEALRKEMKAIARGLDEEEVPGSRAAPGPFATDDGDLKAIDPIERSLQTVQQRLSSSIDRSLSPRPSKENEHVQAACARLLRLHQLRCAALDRLRQCAKDLPDALPSEQGPLAGPRSQLVVLAAAIAGPRVETELLDDGDEAEDELDGACRSILDVVAQAVKLSDKVQGIAALLQHSIKFAEVRSHMLDLRSQRRLALAELKDAAGPDALAACSTRLPSMTSLFDSARCSSGMTTPGSRPGFSPRRSLSVGDLRSQAVTPARPRPPPRLEAVCEPLMSPGGLGNGSRRTAKGFDESFGRESVDFGFRPDGIGEEPLENWSLFKVSKGLSDFDASGKACTEKASSKSLDAKAARLAARIAGASTDFREYVAQAKQGGMDMWHSGSAPDLLQDKWKRGPSLPQLVTRPGQPQQAATGSSVWTSSEAGGARKAAAKKGSKSGNASRNSPAPGW